MSGLGIADLEAAPLEPTAPWAPDGPLLPIEFAREADGGELATALAPGVADVQVFSAPLATTRLDEAREQLRQREKIPAERRDGIGSTTGFDATDAIAHRIAEWARTMRLDAVVWTALPPRSKGVEGRMPTVDEACEYLERLPDDAHAHAEQYVRCVPPTLRTRYRAAFEARFGWTPHAHGA